MQLLGLHWAGVESHQLTPFARAVLAEQPNGGWRQRSNQETENLFHRRVTLCVVSGEWYITCGRAYQKGVHYLLRTQQSDGSWHVASRSPEIQAYFEGGFPYGHDQWISSWGTAWASIAITQTLPVGRPMAMARAR